MAGQTPRVSRIWLRAHGRPRGADGTFAPGFFLWTRNDGESRWLYWPKPSDEVVWEHQWLSDHGRRVLTHLALLIVVAFLVVLGWP
jgi:hypothetical protein